MMRRRLAALALRRRAALLSAPAAAATMAMTARQATHGQRRRRAKRRRAGRGRSRPRRSTSRAASTRPASTSARLWALYTNLLVRTLVGYKHTAGVEGNELFPDLAAEMPEVSEDGLTYTFTLKDGVMFGPPLSREITSQDILYAFERIGTESLVAQYGFYYTVIKGWRSSPRPAV